MRENVKYIENRLGIISYNVFTRYFCQNVCLFSTYTTSYLQQIEDSHK